MKKLIFTSLAVLFSCQLQAGIVLEQQMEGSETNTCIIQIQDHLIRTDVGTDVSSISNTKTGETMTIMHQGKQVMKIKGTPPTPEGAPATPKLEFKDTGAVETINGHECRIVKTEVGGAQITYWVAKSYPDYAKIKAVMAPLSQNATGSTPQEMPAIMDGMIIKTSTVSPQYVAVTTLKSVRIEDISPDAFKAPEGYTVIDIGQ